MGSNYKYVVKYEKCFLEGNLKGLKIDCELGFMTYNDAKFFAMQDGLIISPCGGSGEYEQANSRIVRSIF